MAAEWQLLPELGISTGSVTKQLTLGVLVKGTSTEAFTESPVPTHVRTARGKNGRYPQWPQTREALLTRRIGGGGESLILLTAILLHFALNFANQLNSH